MKLFIKLVLSILISICLLSTGFAQGAEWVKKGSLYTDTKSRASISIPDNWSFKEQTQAMSPMHNLCIQAFSPDFKANIVFLGMKNVNTFTAEEAIKIDIAQLEASSTLKFVLVEKGPVTVAGIKGYKMLDKLTQSGIETTQERIYLVSGDYLYAVILNTIGAGSYDMYKSDFDNTLKSISLPK